MVKFVFMGNDIFQNDEGVLTLINRWLPPAGLATVYLAYSFTCQTAFTKESLDQRTSLRSQSEICQCLDDWQENSHNNSPSGPRIPQEPVGVTGMAGNNSTPVVISGGVTGMGGNNSNSVTPTGVI